MASYVLPAKFFRGNGDRCTGALGPSNAQKKKAKTKDGFFRFLGGAFFRFLGAAFFSQISGGCVFEISGCCVFSDSWGLRFQVSVWSWPGLVERGATALWPCCLPAIGPGVVSGPVMA